MKRVVFYSWQADLPNPTNRGFIEKSLEIAAKAIANDDSVEIEPTIDRDTQGLGGSQDIAAAIFRKIDNADAVVCDVSVIGTVEKRAIPNPNVLLELGYAIRSKGWDRIIMVCNTHYGEIPTLPFDLRTRSVIGYKASPEDSERPSERKRLAAVFEAVLKHTLKEDQPSPDIVEKVKDLIDGNKRAALQTIVTNAATEVEKQLTSPQFDLNQQADIEAFKNRVNDYDNLCLPLATILANGCYFDSEVEPWTGVVEQIASAHEIALASGKNRWIDLQQYPGLLVFYAAGLGAVAAKRYDTLAHLLKNTTYHKFNPTRVREHARDRTSLPLVLMKYKLLQSDLFTEAYKHDRYIAISEHLFAELQIALQGIVPNRGKFDDAFNKFEYLCGLYIYSNPENPTTTPWGPVGSFIRNRRYEASVAKDIEDEISKGGNNNSPIIKAKIIGNDTGDFVAKLKAYEEYVTKGQKGLYF